MQDDDIPLEHLISFYILRNVPFVSHRLEKRIKTKISESLKNEIMKLSSYALSEVYNTSSLI